MANCYITSGIETTPCRDSIPGISKYLIANVDDILSITEVDGLITDITMSGGTNFFTFKVVPESSSFEQAPTVSVENNVSYYTQTITMGLGSMDAAKREQIKVLAAGNFAVIALTKNGKYWLLGKSGDQDTGLYSSGGSVGSGKSGTDASGAVVEMTGNVAFLAPEVDATIIDALLVAAV